MNGVLGEAAVGRHPRGTVPLGPVAVVEARRVLAGQAVVAPAAAAVRLDAHAVADGELVHPAADRRHRAGPLVAGRVVTERRCQREMAVEDLQVGPAHAAHRHLDQHLAWPGPRYRTVDHADVAGAEQYRGAHDLRYLRAGG